MSALSGSTTIPCRHKGRMMYVITSQHNKNNHPLCVDCFDQTEDVEYTCKQRTLTLRWPTTRLYGPSEASALSRDQYIFTKRAEFMHLIHGPQMFALNVLKNQPPWVSIFTTIFQQGQTQIQTQFCLIKHVYCEWLRELQVNQVNVFPAWCLLDSSLAFCNNCLNHRIFVASIICCFFYCDKRFLCF